jgi:hypothetical protein
MSKMVPPPPREPENPSHLITVTEAVRSFGDLIGRVYYKGEEFDIKKGSQIVAHIGPSKQRATIRVAELNNMLAACPSLSKKELEEFEKDLKDIRLSGGELKSKWD